MNATQQDHLHLHSLAPPTPTPAALLSFNPARNSSALTATGDVIRDFTPEFVPKMKVKGNEEIIYRMERHTNVTSS